MPIYKNPLDLSKNLLKKSNYDKVFESLSNLGLDVYKDSDTDISAYDQGDAVRDFKVKVDDNGLKFDTIHIDDKYQRQGWGNKLIKAALEGIGEGGNVQILNSINDDFWNHIIKKYPNYKWSYK